MKGFPDLPPLWLLLFLSAAWGLKALAFGPVLEAAPLRLLGGSCAGAGLAVIAWSLWWFWRKGTTVEPHHTPTKLIVEGPYRLSRNPIYLGMALILLGAVLWWGALLGLGLVVGYVLLIQLRFVRREEAALRAGFGPEAERYLSQTRPWL